MQKPESHVVLLSLMAIRQMTGKQLAEASGSTEPQISLIRNGARPGKKVATRIAAAMNLTDAEIDALGWDIDRTDIREETAGV